MDRIIPEALRKLRKTLASKGIVIKRFVVFGSAASGRRRPDSDVDIAAISEDFSRMNLYKRFTLCGRALVEADIDIPLEVLPFTEREYDEAGKGTFIGDEVKPKGVEVK